MHIEQEADSPSVLLQKLQNYVTEMEGRHSKELAKLKKQIAERDARIQYLEQQLSIQSKH